MRSLQIENHAGHRVGLAFNRNFDDIIVPVPERIRGRAVDALVLGVGQLRATGRYAKPRIRPFSKSP